MINLLLAATLMCPNTMVVNKTSYPWNDFDNWSLDNATKTCSRLYKNSPCLKRFIKVKKQDYHAICGRKE